MLVPCLGKGHFGPNQGTAPHPCIGLFAFYASASFVAYRRRVHTFHSAVQALQLLKERFPIERARMRLKVALPMDAREALEAELASREAEVEQGAEEGSGMWAVVVQVRVREGDCVYPHLGRFGVQHCWWRKV